jgi:hypothetical protein
VMRTLSVRAARATLGALLTLTLMAGAVAAQGSVTPSFGDGTLMLKGTGYRPGERVEITIRAGGQTHRITANADAYGDFLLRTGLAVPALSGLEIDARDESGLTQASITGAPSSSSGSGSSLPLPQDLVPTGSELDSGSECSTDSPQ